jgi:curved DNA-binding protein CbpA
MSSSVSGTFQDYYIVLGIEPRSDSETIQAAYSKLAQKYHPNNGETGDERKFDQVNAAYEILSDPALRLEFDKLKGIDQDAGNPTFSGAEFFEALKRSGVLRSTVLCLLCDRRRLKSTKPTMSPREVETMLFTTNEELIFVVWYLKQRGLAISDDKSNLQISAEGMDYLEKHPPSAEAVLQMVRPEALASHAAAAQKPALSAVQALNQLDRSLRREGVAEGARVEVSKSRV